MSKFPQNWPSWSAKRWMGPPLFSTRNLFYQHVFSGCRPVGVLGYGRTCLASLCPRKACPSCARTHVAWYQNFWCFGISLLRQMCWCVYVSVIFFFFLRLLAVFFLSGPLTQLSCVSLLLLPQQQTNLINIRPPVSKCFSVPANETSLESVSTIAFFHSEKSIYFLDLNWFEIFIWPHLRNWTAPV